ncbi:MAG: chemotaxis response regulator protein-glutamate methylesterase [Phycisphaerae bacterium]
MLVVDDSAIVRSILRGALERHPRMEVVGVAVDGLDALKKIAALRPDVVTLDVEMPRLNGLGVLERAAGKLPVSFVMISTLTQSGAQITFEALRRGAFDYVPKPETGNQAALEQFRRDVQRKVATAAKAKGRARRIFSKGDAKSAAPTLPPNQVRGWVVAIGISCGGPPTLTEMMPAFPSDFVPIVITQHMPAGFTKAFAKQLDGCCAMKVQEAEDGQPLVQGTALIAPGDRHLRLVRRGSLLLTKLDAGPRVSGHCPSVDVMFTSVAEACGTRSVGVIMTGMGRDGSDGIQALRAAGAQTVAQDQESSLVYGMPKAAAATGCIDHVLPYLQIPQALARLIKNDRRPVSAGV